MKIIDGDALDTRPRGNRSQRVMWNNINRIVKEAPELDVVPRTQYEELLHSMDRKTPMVPYSTQCLHCGAYQYTLSPNYCYNCGIKLHRDRCVRCCSSCVFSRLIADTATRNGCRLHCSNKQKLLTLGAETCEEGE